MSQNDQAPATKYRVKTLGGGQSTYLDTTRLHLALSIAIQEACKAETGNHPNVLVLEVNQVDEAIWSETQVALVSQGIFQINLQDQHSRAALEEILTLAAIGLKARDGQSSLPLVEPTGSQAGSVTSYERPTDPVETGSDG